MALNQIMEHAARTLYNPEEMNFEEQVDESFLPYMIQLAQENNINLILVRTSTINSEPMASLDKYNESLDAYLSKKDHIFLVDFRNDPRIKKEFYADDLHFNEYGKVEFTKMLADELIKLVEDNR